jgi:hypothetical protein
MGDDYAPPWGESRKRPVQENNILFLEDVIKP